MAHHVRVEDDLPDRVRYVAGFDASYGGPGRQTGHGALVVVDRDDPELPTLETVTRAVPVTVPYVPGFLAYREYPMLEAVWDAKEAAVDVLVIDGAGLMHPEHFGQACFAGLRLDVPTIGVTKNLFVGVPAREPDEVGDAVPVHDPEDDALLGHAILTTPRSKRPVYVSPGHRVSAETATRIVQSLCTGAHRLPEPTHRAHVAAGEAKQQR